MTLLVVIAVVSFVGLRRTDTNSSALPPDQVRVLGTTEAWPHLPRYDPGSGWGALPSPKPAGSAEAEPTTRGAESPQVEEPAGSSYTPPSEPAPSSSGSGSSSSTSSGSRPYGVTFSR